MLLGGTVELMAGVGRAHGGPVPRHVDPRGSSDGEPTSRDAADLIRAMSGLGTVARVDALQDALVKAYRAGQRAVDQ